MPTSRPPNRPAKADVDPEADRDVVMASSKAQIASSHAAIKAGRRSLAGAKETLAAGRKRIQHNAPDVGSPIANLQKAAKRAEDEGDIVQAKKFAQAACDLAAEKDEDAFEGVLRKLAKPTKG